MTSSSPVEAAPPFVSIVVPAYNDAEHIREAVRSALDQTDGDLELVAVDDCSTDGTAEILEELARADARVRVIRQAVNSTAFQARRTGVLAARGEYVLFLDGDDALAPEAVSSVRRLVASGPDLVHFGCAIVGRDGRHHPGFEAKLAPGPSRLTGRAILDELFLSKDTLEGHLWNKAYRRAYASPLFAAIPDSLRVPRANDLPASLMLAANAATYVSTKAKLYSYYFGSGGVTDGTITTDRFVGLVGFRPSYDAVAGMIGGWNVPEADAASILRTMQAQFVARSTKLLGQVASPNGEELDALLTQWPSPDVLASLYSRFRTSESSFLPFVGSAVRSRATRPTAPVRTVGLYLDQAGIGGMQRVASLQATLLAAHGYRVVMLASMGRDEYPYELPEDGVFVSLGDEGETTREESFRNLLTGLGAAVEEHAIDTVIVHANYRPELIYLALGLREVPVRSVLTVHSFALRAIFDRSPRFAALRAAGMQLDCLAVLSKADETFWRLAGVDRVRYVPNPVDFAMEDEPTEPEPGSVQPDGSDSPDGLDASAQPCDVLWFGRFDERVKRVSEVLRIFALVVRERPEARLHIVGPVPRSQRGTVRSLQTLAEELGIADSVRFLPPTRQIAALLANAKVVLNTSVIEGFGYALVEPSLVGRPVVMYDLPYLAVTDGNPGIVRVPWGDREQAAGAVVGLLDDEASARQSARAGAAFLHEHFSDDVVADRLRAAFAAADGGDEGASPVDPAQELDRARVVVQQLFPLFQDSLEIGASGASAPSVEAFYRTWYGSRTIRYSERLGAPVVRARRLVRRVVRRLRAR